MHTDLEQEIIGLIAEILDLDRDEVHPESRLADDLDVDSIKSIEIIVALEKKYKISVRDDDIPKVTSVKEIIEVTNKLLEDTNTGTVI